MIGKLDDDLTLAIFPAAIVVDLAYWGLYYGLGASSVLQSVTNRAPAMVSSTTHVYNGMIAFLDLTFIPRKSTRRSVHMTRFIVLAYLIWSHMCRHYNGHFPYPFLNKMNNAVYVLFWVAMTC